MNKYRLTVSIPNELALWLKNRALQESERFGENITLSDIVIRALNKEKETKLGGNPNPKAALMTARFVAEEFGIPEEEVNELWGHMIKTYVLARKRASNSGTSTIGEAAPDEQKEEV